MAVIGERAGVIGVLGVGADGWNAETEVLRNDWIY